MKKLFMSDAWIQKKLSHTRMGKNVKPRMFVTLIKTK